MAMKPHCFIQLIFAIILPISTTSASSHSYEPITPLIDVDLLPDNSAHPTPSSMEGLKTFFYNQTIDHFSYRPESYASFPQRYFVKDKYWGGAKRSSPIFVYLGDEADTDLELPKIGFLEENAPKFNALIVYIEHRFYGKSNPMGSMEKSLNDPEIRGYFDSAQALADYAEIILSLKKDLSAQNCPVVVFGGSYGGMLAAWFRLKYPHVALGALASSAPLLQDGNSTDIYLQLATKDYRDTSPNCYATIKQSWDEMDRVADSQPDGVSILNRQFNICSDGSNMTAGGLKSFITRILLRAAQYDTPRLQPVSLICKGIDGSAQGASVIEKLSAGVASLLTVTNPNQTCFNGSELLPPLETILGFTWQICSELVYYRQSMSSNDTTSMFPFRRPFDLDSVMAGCSSFYGVSPRPNWLQTYYGGQEMKLVLKRFGSNVIFSNGLRDPWSGTGVLANLSDTLVAVSTPLGSHCLDLLKSDESDPEWLVAMRSQEVAIIRGWIVQYYDDLIQASNLNMPSSL